MVFSCSEYFVGQPFRAIASDKISPSPLPAIESRTATDGSDVLTQHCGRVPQISRASSVRRGGVAALRHCDVVQDGYPPLQPLCRFSKKLYCSARVAPTPLLRKMHLVEMFASATVSLDLETDQVKHSIMPILHRPLPALLNATRENSPLFADQPPPLFIFTARPTLLNSFSLVERCIPLPAHY